MYNIRFSFQEEDFGPAETTLPPRRRLMTELSDPNENDLKLFQEKLQQKARPSNLQSELQRNFNHDDSILGEVHLGKFQQQYGFFLYDYN